MVRNTLFQLSIKGFILFFALTIHLCTAAQALELYDIDIDDYLTPESSKKISMDFKNAQLNDVLKIFSQQSGMNFIAESDIANKRIDLYLDNVPVEQALERILFANGLSYEISPGSNIFVVKELDTPELQLITKVYRLKHATVRSSKLNTTLSDFSEDGSGSSTSNDFGIADMLKEMLSRNGKVSEDARTNSLIVTDIPSQFPMIEQAISRLDVRTPQILIEVEMLDISKGAVDQLGAKWGATPFTFSGAEKDTFYPFNEDNIFDDNIATHTPGARDDLDFFEEERYRVGTISFSGLNVSLQFLRTHTETKNLARPRILTLNNETAAIQISTDEAVGITSTTTATDAISEGSVEAERVETGVFLKVTPQANTFTGEITMAIEPKVIDTRTSSGFDGAAQFKDPEERGTKSVLRIQDGDTIIIGGLLRTNEDDTRTNVPVLSNIPILGAAFRHKDKSESQRELIIFITPHILKEQFTPKKMVLTEREFIREQDIPQKKLSEIDKELSAFERRR